MSHYKSYPKLKDSGVEWIGNVPEGWNVARIKRFTSLRNERCTDTLKGWRYIGLEDVESGSGKYRPTEGNSRQNEDSTVGVFRSGDVLYGKLRPYLKKAIVSDSDGICSTEFLVMEPKSIMAHWLHQWLLTTEVTQQIETGCEGTKMPRADWEHVGSIYVPSPSQPEQARIIAALDLETARIDAIITKKTQFNELLKEKRSALITHAVTKGLNPNVKMKDSCVEWIGEVPEHWTVSPFKWHIERNDGGVWGNDPTGTNDTIVLRSTEQTADGNWKIDEPASRSIATTEFYSSVLSIGDLVVTKSSGSSLHIGKTTLVTDEIAKLQCCYSNFMQRVRLKNTFIPKLAWYILNNRIAREQFDLASNSTTGLANLNGTMIGQLLLAVPSLDEQNLIAQAIQNGTSRIDLITKKTQHSIDLLKERRSALITAAVTGQIDLREST